MLNGGPVQRRHAGHSNARIAAQFAAHRLRNSPGGENGTALTADFTLDARARRHDVGGFGGGRVTPAGPDGAVVLGAATAGAFVDRRRRTTFSVMSRFLSAQTMGD